MCDPHKEFPQLFKGLGNLRDEYTLVLEQDAEAYAVVSPRRVPLPLFKKTREELERMQKLGVISPVDEATEWCAPMVVVPKPSGNVRICVDLSELNRHVQREWHPIPSVEQTLAQLSGAKIFSRLDANSGFWQIPLSEDSRLLTTFITPFGRFCFNRLPFGISSAPEHFQKRMTRILEGLEGVLCHMDDILIYGSTEEEHSRRLRAVLQRLAKARLTLNSEKCVFRTASITYLGHKIAEDGIRPDDSILESVQQMPPPKNKRELRRILGMATYLARFVPHLADILQPLTSMLSTKNDFVWDRAQQHAFQQWKDILSTRPVLAIFDPTKDTFVSADASAYGLGAVLRQMQSDGTLKVIAYASRTLTDTERRYAQIEKEALAAVWACEKFRDYLIGTKFTLETDHKPLVTLFSTKSLDDLTPRVQRLRMRIMRFSYDIVHVPGKELLAADTLSRAPLTTTESGDLEQEVQAYIQSITSAIPATAPALDSIKAQQAADPVCQQLHRFTERDWPSKRDTPPEIKPFWDHRHRISASSNLLMCGSRIIIPHALRNTILQTLHEGHFGIEKCQLRARDSVWWPGINDDIEQMVKNCTVCAQHRNNRKMPLIPATLPDRPWQKVAMDLFCLKGQWWLVLTDYYSRYPEIARLSSLSSAAVVNHCKSIFARHGIPDEVISDNGPQFSGSEASEFRKFAEEYKFKHTTSSPRYPQSNGLAEAAVKIIKGSMKKTEDPYETLIVYRSTPLKNGYSPAELLMGRRLRTTLPISEEMLRPKGVDHATLKKREAMLKMQQKQQFDKHHGARHLPDLDEGQDVWVIDMQRKGTVKGPASTPRSYLVTTDNGDLRRNRSHLVALPHQLENQQVPDSNTSNSSDSTNIGCGDMSHMHTRSGLCVTPK